MSVKFKAAGIAVAVFVAWLAGVVFVSAMRAASSVPLDSQGLPISSVHSDPGALGQFAVIGLLPAIGLAIWYWWRQTHSAKPQN